MQQCAQLMLRLQRALRGAKNRFDVHVLPVQLALGDKPRVERRRSSTGRVLCDNCGTGISDMYRCCGPCGMDVCLHCCKERRRETGQVREALEPARSTPDLSSN